MMRLSEIIFRFLARTNENDHEIKDDLKYDDDQKNEPDSKIKTTS